MILKMGVLVNNYEMIIQMKMFSRKKHERFNELLYKEFK